MNSRGSSSRLPFGAGRVLTGHPVDVASGVQFSAAHDVEVWGNVPLIWRRIYSTALLQRSPSILGQGWTHMFEMTLVRDLDGYTFTGHGGEQVPFDDFPGVLEAGGGLVNLGNCMELRREGERYAVYHWHDLDSDVQKFLFRDQGEKLMVLDAVEQPSGHGLKMRYDGDGRLHTITQFPERRQLFLEYNQRGFLLHLYIAAPSRVGVAPHRITKYEYDTTDRLVAVYDALGLPTQYVYDAANRLVCEISRAGARYDMRYDARGRCVETTGQNGYGFRSFEFDDSNRITRVSDSFDLHTHYHYNAGGQVELEVRPNGAAYSTKYDELGRKVASIDPLGATTKYDYCDRGNLIATTRPNGGKLVVKFNSLHLPTVITDVDGASWQLDYERGALVRVVDPEGNATVYQRDGDNNLIAVENPVGARVRIDVDATWSKNPILTSTG